MDSDLFGGYGSPHFKQLVPGWLNPQDMFRNFFNSWLKLTFSFCLNIATCTARALAEYTRTRNKDVEAMCDLAMYNYIEVSRTGSLWRHCEVVYHWIRGKNPFLRWPFKQISHQFLAYTRYHLIFVIFLELWLETLL